MRIALFGATGGIGGHLLTRALEHGHDVHALARRPDALTARPGPAPDPEATAGPPAARGRLTVTVGDALDTGAVAEVIAGADAVLSALGPRGVKTPHLLAESAGAIVAGMAKAGPRRLIAVSAAGAYLREDPDAAWLFQLILPRIFGTVWADVRAMEDVIRAADLDWTLVRPVRLVNTPGTGQYRVRPDYAPPHGLKIARADVARFMADVLDQDSWRDAAPALAY
jgi:uncharacterized protein YbjT (DUF2867 family)